MLSIGKTYNNSQQYAADGRWTSLTVRRCAWR
jgi:hypothetical protein